ncbi:hypothetical protein ACFRMQ_21720 [Kitasatospora sp. NPDC056783]|uniref:hypothetical protein n=1 Tax=Kitasatospora sp. NPDC056783 TaxID=3345943 RepID=UPI0036837A75
MVLPSLGITLGLVVAMFLIRAGAARSKGGHEPLLFMIRPIEQAIIGGVVFAMGWILPYLYAAFKVTTGAAPWWLGPVNGVVYLVGIVAMEYVLTQVRWSVG